MPAHRNWKNPDEYSFCESLSSHRLAWEFLRRNPNYQKDWEATLSSYRKEQIADRYGWRSFFQKIFGRTVEKTPPTIEAPTTAGKWGFALDEIANPEIDRPFEDMPIFRESPHIFTDDSGFSGRDLNKDEACFIVNFSQSLEPQLRFLRSELQQIQKDRKIKPTVARLHKNKLPIYLRVLDAKKFNTSNAEIARIIYPKIENSIQTDFAGSRQIRDDLKASKRLINGKYLDLVKPTQSY